MPRYDYHCTECGHAEEVRQKITDDALEVCTKCGRHSFRRGPGGGAGLIFKGDGFYITDYRDQPSGKSGTTSDS